MKDKKTPKLFSYISYHVIVSIILHSSVIAQTTSHAWIHAQDPKIGHWQSGRLSMQLMPSGQVTLTQSLLMIKGINRQALATPATTLYGYWWSDSEQLCLNFDLHSRCQT